MLYMYYVLYVLIKYTILFWFNWAIGQGSLGSGVVFDFLVSFRVPGPATLDPDPKSVHCAQMSRRSPSPENHFWGRFLFFVFFAPGWGTFLLLLFCFCSAGCRSPAAEPLFSKAVYFRFQNLGPFLTPFSGPCFLKKSRAFLFIF